jgi:hypothetical protein
MDGNVLTGPQNFVGKKFGWINLKALSYFITEVVLKASLNISIMEGTII